MPLITGQETRDEGEQDELHPAGPDELLDTIIGPDRGITDPPDSPEEL